MEGIQLVRKEYFDATLGVALEDIEHFREDIVKFEDNLKKMTVLASSYAKGDGASVDSVGLQQAINASIGKHLLIDKPQVKYITNRLDIPSDIIITIDPGVLIEANTNFGLYENIFRIHNSENVLIRGNYATLDVKRTMQPGNSEQRHAIAIFGGKNIGVYDLNILNAGGDGVLVGGNLDGNSGSKKVVVSNCIIDNSYRFGATAVGNAEDIVFEKLTIKNHNNTISPVVGGMDIEPNEGDKNNNVTVRDCVFENNTRGILVFDDSQNIVLENNTFDNSLGITVQKVNVNRASPGVSIRNNYFKRDSKGGAAIAVNGANNIEVVGNKVINFNVGIYVMNSYGEITKKTYVRDNKMYDLRQGIVIEASDGIIVSGNKVELTSQESIHVSGSSDVTILDNDFSDYTLASQIITSDGVEYRGNKMRRSSKTPTTALNVPATSDRVVVKDNDFTDGATNSAYFITSPSANIGYNININGFNTPYLNEFNPSLTENMLGQLFLRVQNNRYQLQTAINRGGDLAFVRVPTVFIGTAAPTSGTYVQGDIVMYPNPTAGGTPGLICVVSGSPGTWGTYGGTIVNV